MKKQILKSVSLVLMLSFIMQLIVPLKAYALTTGPSQPEVQAFEPVGTTEMVDLFTGDFVYNIPLMDVDGYPINLSYHGGVTMEQEASWVGLGWSLNPGEVNRSVRGMPDDFNGQKIRKTIKAEEERNFMGRVGAQFGLEIFGKKLEELGIKLGADVSLCMNLNNYKGISAGIRAGISARFGQPGTDNPANSIGFSPSIGIGSQSGVDLDASLSFKHAEGKKDAKSQQITSLSVGSGINTRTGMKNIAFNLRVGEEVKKTHTQSTSNFGSTIPVGIQNYVPVITNASVLKSFDIQVKIGVELYGTYPDFYVGVGVSKMNIAEDGTRPAYGYMNLEKADADHTGILDFTRDRDGMYNKTMRNLPPSSLAYDIYAVSGQGTGGSFRPFRNDIGSVYDPLTGTEQKNLSGALEIGAGNLYEIGGEVNYNKSINTTGPWVTIPYQGEKNGLYEKTFFKQGGELTYNRQAESNQNLLFTGSTPITVQAAYNGNVFQNAPGNVQVNYANSSGSGQVANGIRYAGMDQGRTVRSNMVTILTADKAASPYISAEPKILNYSGTPGNTQISQIDRLPAGATGDSLKSRISYISQLLPDGRRYIYGIPAMNNISKDVTYGASGGGNTTGMIIDNIGSETPVTSTQDPEKYYSSTVTPAYAHSFLLTEVLSQDYVDITGNGCSDDDIGGYVKLNYSRKSADYRWRSPAYDVSQANVSGHFEPGFQSDPRDGRVNVSMGSREQWYVHTIESKNLVAEFYTSPRQDAKGMPDKIDDNYLKTSVNSPDQNSYKLDSIRLFNKNQRYTQGSNAVPIKTVIFNYDYSLCPGTPNSGAGTKGKLTLKNLYVRYGNSDKNLLSPYRFEYNTLAANYNYGRKDRWGNVNDINGNINLDVNSFEFPYTSQKNVPGLNQYPVTAYNLTGIILPSGGRINVEYEPDDYGYVQDKRAMEMFKLEGVGGTPNYSAGSILYQKDAQFNYLYFRRDPAREWGTPSGGDLKPYYLEGEEHLYFSVSTDIRGGNYESIKGFGKIQEVGICNNNLDYGYVKLERVNSNGISFSPVTLYCMNFAKWYLNHIVYPGYGTTDLKDVLKAFASAAGELKHLGRPLKTFIDRGYCQNINLAKSWIRLQTPSIAKKGGGVRVKRLTIDDQWQSMTGSNLQSNGSYGREYDYTIKDAAHGGVVISSGVASYEPLIGGDENPLRNPIPYTAAENIALPAVQFYQLQPLGENFYPSPVVGYSSVSVRSTNIDKGKSSMSEEVHSFYTAKDYPVRVEYTTKNGNAYASRSLMEDDRLEQASQGYTVYLNDMHGKPKAKTNYLVKRFENGKVQEEEQISRIDYKYNQTANGQLSSQVKAFRLDNGTYKIHDMELGKETDVVFDSRQNYDETESVGASFNLNLFVPGATIIGIPTVFQSYKKEKTIFHSMVCTKVVQQYGILKQIVTNDHGAETMMENMVYDAESGNVLLTRTTNEFSDNEYMQQLPAYLAYDGMGPAYMNIGLKDQPLNMYINRVGNGYMNVNNVSNYSNGDELYYNRGTVEDKLWVMDRKSVALPEYYGYDGENTGTVAFFPDNSTIGLPVKVTVSSQVLLPTVQYTDPWGLLFNSTNSIALNPGTYTFNVISLGQNVTNADPLTVTVTPGSLSVYNVWSFDTGPESNSVHNYKLKTTLITDSKCMLKVLPRYKDAHAPGSATGSYWWATGNPKKITRFSTEVVRSGRRNMLGSTIQQVVSTQAPASLNDGMELDHFLVRSGLITASAQTYKDAANIYEQYDRTIVPVASGSSALVYESMNDYVLGLRGTYRPEKQLTAFANRDYAASHSRRDGTYALNALYWEWNGGLAACGWKPYVSEAGQIEPAWKMSTLVTKYDMFGNAVEEKDALNIYSAAQYGYNKRLPVAVAANARLESIMYESFEDLGTQIIPDYLAGMFYSYGMSAYIGGANVSSRPVPAYLHTPFSRYFSVLNTSPVTQSGQTYYRTGYAGANGTQPVVMTGYGHTGYKMLNVPAGYSFSIPVRSFYPDNTIGSFAFVKDKKYIVNLWVQKAAGVSSPVIQLTANGNAVATFASKGVAIEGWQLMEAKIDMPLSAGNAQFIGLAFSGGAVIDDIRIMPLDANMKTFVYDVANNNRLMAQLDENHYATFYEYDQEGQLIRVKKETEKGIVTVSESRRALRKN